MRERIIIGIVSAVLLSGMTYCNGQKVAGLEAEVAAAETARKGLAGELVAASDYLEDWETAFADVSSPEEASANIKLLNDSLFTLAASYDIAVLQYARVRNRLEQSESNIVVAPTVTEDPETGEARTDYFGTFSQEGSWLQGDWEAQLLPNESIDFSYSAFAEFTQEITALDAGDRILFGINTLGDLRGITSTWEEYEFIKPTCDICTQNAWQKIPWWVKYPAIFGAGYITKELVTDDQYR